MSVHESWTKHYDTVSYAAKRFESQAIVVSKDSWVWRVLWVFICVLMSKEKFLHNYATAIGPFVALPSEWSLLHALELLPHECRHVTQFKYAGLGSAWLGMVPMFLAYVLLLPVLFNPFRFYLERDADRAYWKWLVEQGRREQVMLRANSFALKVASRNYGWCWPKSWAVDSFRKAAVQVVAA
jgi:hypothetical protein